MIIARHIAELARGHRICTELDLDAGEAIRKRAMDLMRRLSENAPDLLGSLIAESRLAKGHIELTLNAVELANELGLEAKDFNPAALKIQAPFKLRRSGVEGKLVTGDREPAPDRTLVRALARAHDWTTDLRKGKPLSAIAAATRHSESYIRTRAQLAFLAPAIQSAILDGRQPPELTLEQIVRKPIPLDWDEQVRRYGFDRDDPGLP